MHVLIFMKCAVAVSRLPKRATQQPGLALKPFAFPEISTHRCFTMITANIAMSDLLLFSTSVHFQTEQKRVVISAQIWGSGIKLGVKSIMRGPFKIPHRFMSRFIQEAQSSGSAASFIWEVSVQPFKNDL